MTEILTVGHFEFRIDPETDLINSDDMICTGSNPHNVRPWVIHNAGSVLGVVFASNEQDALDEMVDKHKLDGYLVSANDLADYETGKDSDGNPKYEGITNLGNAGEPFDISGLDLFSVNMVNWTINFWSEEQIKAAVDSVLEDFTVVNSGYRDDGPMTCSLNDVGIDSGCTQLACYLKELNRRLKVINGR